MQRAALLAAVDSALRSDYFFLHDLEAAMRRFQAEEQTLGSTTTLASTVRTLRGPSSRRSPPRLAVSFPFYASPPDAPSTHTVHIADSTHTGAYGDYADFLILLSRYDANPAAATGARWIMSMSDPGRGVFTSPEWLYRAPRTPRFVLMAEQRGYERFLQDAAAAGAAGVVLVRVGGAGEGVRVRVTLGG